MAAYWKPLSEPPQHEGLCLCKTAIYPHPFFSYWTGATFTDASGMVVAVTEWRSVLAGHELEQAISNVWSVLRQYARKL